MKTKFEVGVELKKISNILEQNANKDLESLGITHTQVHILMYLLANKNREIYQREIEEQFDLKNPTVTGILNRLEEKEFITRSINSEDARYKKIEITPKTIQLHNSMKKKLEGIKRKMIDKMSEKEIEQLENLLQKVLNNLSSVKLQEGK